MCTRYSYKKLFTDYMDEKDIKWRDLEEDSLLVTFTAENVPKVEVTVEFGEDEENRSTATCWSIASGGDVTLNAVMRVVTIVDEAYPDIMRALWAQ